MSPARAANARAAWIAKSVGRSEPLPASHLYGVDRAPAGHAEALALFEAGNYAAALRDIEAALQREPRDFTALQSLSHSPQ